MKFFKFQKALFTINYNLKKMTNINILTSPFLTKYATAPFNQIKIEFFKPAFEENIKSAKEEIEKIVSNTEEPNFKNTIEALDYSGEQLDRVSNIFFNLNSAETNEEMQKIAQEISPIISDFANDISFNEKLFLRVKEIYEKKDSYNLTTEQMTLLNKRFTSFTRNGALLSEEKKEQLREIDRELSQLGLKFDENVLAETNKYELHIKEEDEYRLKGLPESSKDAAREAAKAKNQNGFIFDLNFPSYFPFVSFLEDRELRKEMTIAYGKKGFQNNENDNQENIKKIVSLKHKRAQLLGYESHAHYVLEERMSENSNKVFSFLNDLKEKSKPAAHQQFKELTDFANSVDGLTSLEKWDGSFYTEKLKKKLFNIDDELLRPYFELEKVLNGAFIVANKLYGLNFKQVFDIDTYHKDVRTYEVTDESGNFIAVFYADFFPRKGKNGGAWMTSYRNQYKNLNTGEEIRPHVAIVCNFTPPTETKPSLLTFMEVTTLFHEFGHSLHGMLSKVTYPSLNGTNVYWDFVELPSQMLENWCYEAETLELFAKHYETGELIPQEYVEKIKESSNFMEGMATLRQLYFAFLDMAYHSNPQEIENVKEFEKKASAECSLYPDVNENCMSTSFSHIFAGGYSAGYYSYKWAEVLDADAFAYFKENGIFNKEISKKFMDNILTRGGSDHPMNLYKNFRGREPTVDALLKRAGLL
jgi:Zn-dependent oligopeptidase